MMSVYELAVQVIINSTHWYIYVCMCFRAWDSSNDQFSEAASSALSNAH